MIAGTTPATRWRYAVLRSEEEPELIFSLDAIHPDDPAEVVAYVSLAALGTALAKAAPRPLFTLVAPVTRGNQGAGID